MRASQTLYLVDRNEWHDWLEQNHDAKEEVWLIFYKRDTCKPTISYEDAVEEALSFGWIDSIIKKIDDEKFARKFTPRKPRSKWSQSNKKRVEKMITEGKMTEAGLAQIAEAKKSGEWFKTVTPQQTLMIPPFIEQALKANKKAQDNFNNLAKSYKRQYVGWITSAKREETLKRRLEEVVKALEKNEKLGMK